MTNLISQETLLNEINHLYNLNYGEQLIDPQAFYEMVECQEVIKKQKPRTDREIRDKVYRNRWIPTSERLPQLPDGKSFMPLNATILAPSGLRNTVQMTWELKRGKPTWCYLGEISDWNVIAWQPLPEPYKEEI